MTERSLQVPVGRAGHLRRTCTCRIQQAKERADGGITGWLWIVDYSASGDPLGVEITAPQAVPPDRLNQLLAELGEPAPHRQDYKTSARRRRTPARLLIERLAGLMSIALVAGSRASRRRANRRRSS